MGGIQSHLNLMDLSNPLITDQTNHLKRDQMSTGDRFRPDYTCVIGDFHEIVRPGVGNTVERGIGVL